MADGRKRCVGRPRKHDGGWANEHRRLSVSNDTFAVWRELRAELGLTSDDAVAIVLITAYRDTHRLQSNETVSREDHRSYNRFAKHLHKQGTF